MMCLSHLVIPAMVMDISIPLREHPFSTYALRGRGCQGNDQFLCTIVLIGCVKSVQEGGRGSKKPENLRTYLMDAPLRNFSIPLT